MTKPTLYLIRGLPGSGKTTFAKNLEDARLVESYYEADMYFMVDGEYKFDPAKLKYAHGWCQDRVSEDLSLGLSVAVSNTSTAEFEVETYRQIAESFEANFVSIVVENRHKGKNVHDVPEEALTRMENRFTLKLR